MPLVAQPAPCQAQTWPVGTRMSACRALRPHAVARPAPCPTRPAPCPAQVPPAAAQPAPLLASGMHDAARPAAPQPAPGAGLAPPPAHCSEPGAGLCPFAACHTAPEGPVEGFPQAGRGIRAQHPAGQTSPQTPPPAQWLPGSVQHFLPSAQKPAARRWRGCLSAHRAPR